MVMVFPFNVFMKMDVPPRSRIAGCKLGFAVVPSIVNIRVVSTVIPRTTLSSVLPSDFRSFYDDQQTASHSAFMRRTIRQGILFLQIFPKHNYKRRARDDWNLRA